MSNKLTGKQRMFVKEYLKDLNATQAAIRAGYSNKCAQEIGWENLRKPKIQDEIQKAKEKRNKIIEVDANYVLKRLIEIDEMDVLDIVDDDGMIKPVRGWPKSWRTTISGIDAFSISGSPDVLVKKIKWPDKVRNLEMIGRHTDVRAWENKEQGGSGLDVNSLVDALGDLANRLPV